MADDTPSGLLLFAISFGLLLAFVLLLWAINVLPQKVRAIMSRSADAPVRESVPDPVHVPVPPTSTNASTGALVLTGTDAVIPDTDALEAGTDTWETPRISRRLNDDDMIALLAVQRTQAGKLRYSANQIHTLVGGPRAHVLALVKSIREGPAEFRPLTPEQESNRRALGLNS